MRRKKNKQMEGQMSIFDMFSSVIENTKTEEEKTTVKPVKKSPSRTRKN